MSTEAPKARIPVSDLEGRDPSEVVAAIVKAQSVIGQVAPKAVAASKAEGRFTRPPAGWYWTITILMAPGSDEYDAFLTCLSAAELATHPRISVEYIDGYMATRNGNAIFAYFRQGEFFMGQMVDVEFLAATGTYGSRPYGA